MVKRVSPFLATALYPRYQIGLVNCTAPARRTVAKVPAIERSNWLELRPETKFAQVVSTKTGSTLSVLQMKFMASTPKPFSSPLAGSLMVEGGEGM